jgi:hypothetical protein
MEIKDGKLICKALVDSVTKKPIEIDVSQYSDTEIDALQEIALAAEECGKAQRAKFDAQEYIKKHQFSFESLADIEDLLNAVINEDVSTKTGAIILFEKADDYWFSGVQTGRKDRTVARIKLRELEDNEKYRKFIDEIANCNTDTASLTAIQYQAGLLLS